MRLCIYEMLFPQFASHEPQSTSVFLINKPLLMFQKPDTAVVKGFPESAKTLLLSKYKKGVLLISQLQTLHRDLNKHILSI